MSAAKIREAISSEAARILRAEQIKRGLSLTV
jgi:hypothetical protein